MPTHIVAQGECLSSLAARCGLEAKDLHDHPDNAALKEKRPYPNILAPGDEVVIPELNQKRIEAATGRVHRFVLNRRMVKLRLALLNAQGMPYEGKRFVLVAGATELKGKTAAGGLIEGDVPADVQSGQLRVWLTDDDDDPDPHIDRGLAIGHLDPIDLVSGVQGRLENLGYPCAVTGESDDATLVAVRMFRSRNGLSDDENSDPDAQGDTGSDVSNTGDADDSVDTDEGEQAGEPDSTVLTEKSIDDPLRAKLQGLYEEK